MVPLTQYWDGWEPGSEQHTMLCQVRSVVSVAQLVGPLFTVAHSDSFAHIYKTAGYSSSVIPSNSDFSLFLQNTHRPLVKCWSHSLLVQTPGMMAERMILFPSPLSLFLLDNHYEFSTVFCPRCVDGVLFVAGFVVTHFRLVWHFDLCGVFDPPEGTRRMQMCRNLSLHFNKMGLLYIYEVLFACTMSAGFSWEMK